MKNTRNYYKVGIQEDKIVIRDPDGSLSLMGNIRDTLEETLYGWVSARLYMGDNEERICGAIEKVAEFFDEDKKGILVGDNNHVWNGIKFNNLQMWQILLAKEDGLSEDGIKLWANGKLNASEMLKKRFKQNKEEGING